MPNMSVFLSSVIALLNKARDDGGFREAFEAILLGEVATVRYIPSDAELERMLRKGDCYAFRRAFYLLATLENSRHAKNPPAFSDGAFSVECVVLSGINSSLERYVRSGVHRRCEMVGCGE